MKRNSKLHVYLAGPDVFLPNPIQIGEAKKKLVELAGCIAHFPMDPEIKNFQPNEETARNIAKGNEALMDICQVILINMTPWHGPSMDVGTAFEAGYMSGKAKFCPDNVLIIGYYEGEVNLNFVDRVAQTVYNNEVIRHSNGMVTDKNGIILENFSLSENLMIPAAIKKTGGALFSSFEEAANNIKQLWTNKKLKLSLNRTPITTTLRVIFRLRAADIPPSK